MSTAPRRSSRIKEKKQLEAARRAAEREAQHAAKLAKYHCHACWDTHWWCRGCGSSDVTDALVKSGMDDQEAEDLVSIYFDDCGLPMVPCYLCNRNGQTDYRGQQHMDADFWHNN